MTNKIVIWKNPIYFLAFGFGSGLLPFAPGTWGTLAAIPLFLLLSLLSPWIYGLLLIPLFLLGVWVCDVTEKAVGIPDYSGIVWDEVLGFLLTMWWAPSGWIWIVVGFFLFRLFDVWKPFPIRWFDRRVKGGLGIMLDDVGAGLYAWIGLHLIFWFGLG